MKKDQSALEILDDYAKRTGRKLESSVQYHDNWIPLNPQQYHRWKAYMANNDAGTSYFCAYADSKEFGDWALYSGVFIAVPLPSAVQAMIRKSDVLDRWNPFGSKCQYKTGIQRFDRKTIITGNDSERIIKTFSRRHIHDLVLEAFDIDMAMRVVVNHADLNYIPGFKGQSHLGIIRPRKWLLEGKVIDKLFELGERLRERLA